jgi:hypothetical protein
MTSNKSSNRAGNAAGWIVIALILCQFTPLDRVSHPAKPSTAIPGNILAVLKTRCFDCHANETNWPRSAYIAPLSWYVTAKVHESRNALNFSNFDALPDAARRDVEHSVASFARNAKLPAHGAIPGFSPVSLSETERMTLAGWASNNNREQRERIRNSSH